MQRLEEQIAQLQRIVDELSDVIARQDGEIETLKRRVALLMTREAERQAGEGEEIFTGPERPPHW